MIPLGIIQTSPSLWKVIKSSVFHLVPDSSADQEFDEILCSHGVKSLADLILLEELPTNFRSLPLIISSRLCAYQDYLLFAISQSTQCTDDVLCSKSQFEDFSILDYNPNHRLTSSSPYLDILQDVQESLKNHGETSSSSMIDSTVILALVEPVTPKHGEHPEPTAFDTAEATPVMLEVEEIPDKEDIPEPTISTAIEDLAMLQCTEAHGIVTKFPTKQSIDNQVFPTLVLVSCLFSDQFFMDQIQGMYFKFDLSTYYGTGIAGTYSGEQTLRPPPEPPPVTKSLVSKGGVARYYQVCTNSPASKWGVARYYHVCSQTIGRCLQKARYLFECSQKNDRLPRNHQVCSIIIHRNGQSDRQSKFGGIAKGNLN